MGSLAAALVPFLGGAPLPSFLTLALGVLGACCLALGAPPRLPEPVRGVGTALCAGLLVALALKLHPAVPPLPVLRWTDGLPLEIRDVFPPAVLLLLYALPRSLDHRGRSRRIHLGLAAAGILLLGGYTLLPRPHQEEAMVTAPEGSPTVPVWQGGRVVPLRWDRQVFEGVSPLVTPRVVRSTWALGAAARGLQEEAQSAEVAAGRLSPATARLRSVLRGATWTTWKASVAALLGVRVLLLPLALAGLGLALAGRSPPPRTRGVVLTLLATPLLAPAALTLGFLAVLLATGLPEGRPLQGGLLASALLPLSATGAVLASALGVRRGWSGHRSPQETR